MPFDLELLKIELEKYSNIIQLEIYHDTNLEIKVKNLTGRQTTYERIEQDFIIPYYNKIESNFGNGYYKGAFFIKINHTTEGLLTETIQ